jgi:hypothetical protein
MDDADFMSHDFRGTERMKGHFDRLLKRGIVFDLPAMLLRPLSAFPGINVSPPGEIRTLRAGIPFEFPTDRRGVDSKCFGDLLLSVPCAKQGD